MLEKFWKIIFLLLTLSCCMSSIAYPLDLLVMAEEAADVVQLLKRQKAKLIKIISAEADFVLQSAHSCGLLSDQGYEQIKSCCVPSEKVRDLLDHVISRGPKAAQGMLDLLKEKEMQETFPMLSFVKELRVITPLSGTVKKKSFCVSKSIHKCINAILCFLISKLKIPNYKIRFQLKGPATKVSFYSELYSPSQSNHFLPHYLLCCSLFYRLWQGDREAADDCGSRSWQGLEKNRQNGSGHPECEVGADWRGEKKPRGASLCHAPLLAESEVGRSHCCFSALPPQSKRLRSASREHWFSAGDWLRSSLTRDWTLKEKCFYLGWVGFLYRKMEIC